MDLSIPTAFSRFVSDDATTVNWVLVPCRTGFSTHGPVGVIPTLSPAISLRQLRSWASRPRCAVRHLRRGLLLFVPARFPREPPTPAFELQITYDSISKEVSSMDIRAAPPSFAASTSMFVASTSMFVVHCLLGSLCE